ncbi:MAG: hypothetical protein AB9835_06305 [Eubacteriales bacterium]
MFKKLLLDSSRKHNSVTYTSMVLIMTIGMTFCMDGYIQSYLLKLGIGTQGVGLYGFVIQITALVTYLAASTIAVNAEKFMSRYIKSAFGISLLPVGLIISIQFKNFLPAVLPVIFIAGSIQSACISYKSTAEYCLIPYIIKRKDYVKLYSGAAIAGGVVSAIITYLFDNTKTAESFPGGYMRLFSLSAVFIVLGGVLAITLRPDFVRYGKSQAKKITYKDIFLKLLSGNYNSLLFPHILRGVGIAGMYFIIPVTMKNIALTEQHMTKYVITCVLTGIAGNVIFLLVSKFLRTGVVTLTANVVCSVCLILIAFNKSIALFFIIIGVFQCFNIISQLSIPAGVLRSTANEDLPFISSLRLFLTSAVSSVLILLFGWLLSFVLPVIIMFFCALVFTYCGYLYSHQFEDNIS